MFEDNKQKTHRGLNPRDVIRLGATAAVLPLLGDIAAFCQVESGSPTIRCANWRICFRMEGPLILAVRVCRTDARG
jgi:hypothetical protein